MEKKFHHYNLEGLELEVPMHKRESRTEYSENLNFLFSRQLYTPLGSPVIVCWGWICEHFDKSPSCTKENLKNCECSDCKYFVRAESDVGYETQIGICTHESMKCRVESAECRIKTESVKNE